MFGESPAASSWLILERCFERGTMSLLKSSIPDLGFEGRRRDGSEEACLDATGASFSHR